MPFQMITHFYNEPPKVNLQRFDMLVWLLENYNPFGDPRKIQHSSLHNVELLAHLMRFFHWSRPFLTFTALQELENLEFLQAKGSEFAERKLNEVPLFVGWPGGCPFGTTLALNSGRLMPISGRSRMNRWKILMEFLGQNGGVQPVQTAMGHASQVSQMAEEDAKKIVDQLPGQEPLPSLHLR